MSSILAASKVNPVTFRSLYARRIPSLAIWASGLTFFLCWPMIWAKTSNKLHNVPQINQTFI